MNPKALIEKLQSRYHLTANESSVLVRNIISEAIDPVLVSSILTLMNTRPYAVSEVLGFREALLESAILVDLSQWSPLDVCGTGGDGKSTFNISTASALLLAAAKVPVAKHGNHGVSSLFGSSTIIEAMGYRFSTDESKLKRELDTCSICFLHAPLFHPAMKQLAPIRKALGVRTIFNILGPLLNPASVHSQMSGVYDMEIFPLYVEVLRCISEKSMVVHTVDGHDEVSLSAPCHISTNGVSSYLEPGVFPYCDILFPCIQPKVLRATDTIQEAVSLMMAFLKGEADSDLEKVIITNAALAYTMKYPEVNLSSAMALLKDVISSGAAYDTTRKLLELQC